MLSSVLLGLAHLLARLQDLRVRLPHAVDRAIAVPHVLLERNAVAARIGARGRVVAVGVAVGVHRSDVGDAGDRGAVAGHRAGDILVDRARRRTGRVQFRIEDVGLGEGAGDRLGMQAQPSAASATRTAPGRKPAAGPDARGRCNRLFAANPASSTQHLPTTLSADNGANGRFP